MHGYRLPSVCIYKPLKNLAGATGLDQPALTGSQTHSNVVITPIVTTPTFACNSITSATTITIYQYYIYIYIYIVVCNVNSGNGGYVAVYSIIVVAVITKTNLSEVTAWVNKLSYSTILQFG